MERPDDNMCNNLMMLIYKDFVKHHIIPMWIGLAIVFILRLIFCLLHITCIITH